MLNLFVQYDIHAAELSYFLMKLRISSSFDIEGAMILLHSLFRSSLTTDERSATIFSLRVTGTTGTGTASAGADGVRSALSRTWIARSRRGAMELSFGYFRSFEKQPELSD